MALVVDNDRTRLSDSFYTRALAQDAKSRAIGRLVQSLMHFRTHSCLQLSNNFPGAFMCFADPSGSSEHIQWVLDRMGKLARIWELVKASKARFWKQVARESSMKDVVVEEFFDEARKSATRWAPRCRKRPSSTLTT